MTAWMKLLLAAGVVVVVAGLVYLLGTGDGPAAELVRGVGTPARSESREVVLPEVAGRPAALHEGSEAERLAVEAAAVPELTESAAVVEEPERTLRVVGRLADPSGRPVPDARVVFHDGGLGFLRFGRDDDEDVPEPPETTSDAEGRFELDVLPSARDDDEDERIVRRLVANLGPRVVAKHDAFVTEIHECPELSQREEAIDLGTITLAFGTAVRGRIVDEVGRPLAGAEVSARNIDEDGGGRMFGFLGDRLAEMYTQAESGVDGRFVVTGLAPGVASVSAVAEDRQVGYVDSVELELASMSDVGDIVLPEGGSISGYVADVDGEPIEGANVRVSSMSRFIVRNMDDVPRAQIGNEFRINELTDADGFFRISGLALGQYTVHVSADGYANRDTENVAVGTRDLSVALDALGSLEVLVLSAADDSPVTGAEITGTAVIEGLRFGRGGDAITSTPLDDEPGLYLLEGAGPTGTELTIRAADFAVAGAEGPPVFSGGSERLTVYLQPESVIAGWVRDQDGEGIAEASVRLSQHEPETFLEHDGGRMEFRRDVRRTIGGPSNEADWLRAATDEEGYFELRGIAAGDWEIVASAEDYVRGDPVLVTLEEGQSQEDVSISLEVGGSISGLVSDSDGQPVVGSDVVVKLDVATGSPGTGNAMEDMIRRQLASVIGDDGGPGAPRRATTDARGRFEVGSLKPGPYEVSVAKSNSGMHMGRAMVFFSDQGGAPVDDPDATRRVDVVAGEEAYVELIRPPMASLEGRVLAAGEGVEGASVALKEAGSFMPFGGDRAETDRYGNYLFENVEPGEYAVSTIVPGAALSEEVEVELEPGRTGKADLRFDGATVSGEVVDGESGDGVPGVTITVTPVQDDGEAEESFSFGAEVVMVASGGGGGRGMSMQFGGGELSKVRTDEKGRFEVRFLDPGKYVIETSGGGYTAMSSDPVEVREGENVDDVHIEVDRGAVVEGVVISGASGQRLDGVPVSLVPMLGEGREMTMTENGSYRFEGLEEGDYTIEVLGSGFSSEPVASETVSLDVGEVRALDLTTEG